MPKCLKATGLADNIIAFCFLINVRVPLKSCYTLTLGTAWNEGGIFQVTLTCSMQTDLWGISQKHSEYSFMSMPTPQINKCTKYN